MKRLIALVVVALLVGSGQGVAQSPVGIDAAAFGDGWTVDIAETDDPAPGAWRTRFAYFGPDGSRALVLVIDLGDSITDQAAGWNAIQQTFGLYAGIPSEHIALADTAMPDGIAPLSGVVSDALRFASLDAYGRVRGAAAYAFSDAGFALIVLADCTVNGLTDISATDYIAGLYLAALSGQ